MKKFFLGLISGILLLIGVNIVFGESYENIHKANINQNNSIILINSKYWEQSKNCISINDMTYVPLRAFCEDNGLDIEWVKMNDDTSRIKVTLPFEKSNEYIECKSEQEILEQFNLGEEIINKISLGEIKKDEFKIKNAAEAAKFAGLKLESIFGNRVHYNKPYFVYYEKNLNSWVVRTSLNYYTEFGVSTGGNSFIVFNEAGDVLYIRQDR